MSIKSNLYHSEVHWVLQARMKIDIFLEHKKHSAPVSIKACNKNLGNELTGGLMVNEQLFVNALSACTLTVFIV